MLSHNDKTCDSNINGNDSSSLPEKHSSPIDTNAGAKTPTNADTPPVSKVRSSTSMFTKIVGESY